MKKQTFVVTECTLTRRGPEAISSFFRETFDEAVKLAAKIVLEKFEEPTEDLKEKIENDLNLEAIWFDDQCEYSVGIGNLTDEINKEA